MGFHKPEKNKAGYFLGGGGIQGGCGTIVGNKMDSFQVLRTQRLGSALQKAPANSSYRHVDFRGPC